MAFKRSGVRSPSAPPNNTRAWRFRQASPAGTKGKARAFVLKLYRNCIVGEWVDVGQQPAKSGHSAKESLTESISWLFTSNGPLPVDGEHSVPLDYTKNGGP